MVVLATWQLVCCSGHIANTWMLKSNGNNIYHVFGASDHMPNLFHLNFGSNFNNFRKYEKFQWISHVYSTILGKFYPIWINGLKIMKVLVSPYNFLVQFLTFFRKMRNNSSKYYMYSILIWESFGSIEPQVWEIMTI